MAAVALAVAVTALPAGAQDDAKKKVLKLGWGQDAQTLNPFVAQDEENFRVWALNWDLLVNFSPDDLSPAPGIAKSWDVSKDKKTVTFHLIEGAKWSDGQPITSKDVKYSLDVLGTNGLIFSGYTSNVTKIDTPDDQHGRGPHRSSPTPASSAACSSTSSRSTSTARRRSSSSPAPTSRSCRWSAAGRTSSPSSRTAAS